MITPLSEALSERGYDRLTPVQEAVIASDVADADLLVSAQTGSGKTVGFGLAIAPTLLGADERFGPAAAPLALIVAPTRELASQVMGELKWLYSRTGAVVTSCVGGMDMRQERRALERGAHIVVGTPGRLRDHIERGFLDLGSVRAVVLDEADEMLDLGFREDLEFMLGAAPQDRRTLLFSATVPPLIAKLARQFQRDAQRISTFGSTEQHADIAYQAVRVAASDVDNAVFNLLRFHNDQNVIVFANTRATVNHLAARLANRGLATVSLSGELSQTERTHALQAMRDGRARVCVATDVAARGIDLPKLNMVIHADLPNNTESLLHRSGRTGRAGRKGISALIVPPKAVAKAERLLKWAKISAEWTVAPSVEDILRKDEAELLSDPGWDTPLTEEEAGFAEKLLARHTPEAIAAGYLRLHQARHAAPEELLPPDTKPARREKTAFGPSRWIALSVGRNDRAEARWLLPLLCRAGKLDKAAIGAIRVQDSETFVELTEASLGGFMASLGAGGVLEEGVSARLLDGPPEISAASHAPRGDGGRPRRGSTDEVQTRPQTAAPSPAKPAPASKQGAERKLERKAPPAPAPEKYKPRKAKPAAPEAAPAEKQRKPKPAAAPHGMDRRGKPRPTADHGGKPGQKPAGKHKGKPAAAPSDARDTSKRFSPPGQGKAGARKPRKPGGPHSGGHTTPRRGKRQD